MPDAIDVRVGSGGAARWSARSAGERETFLAAIARHRRASWRVTAACAVAVIVLAIVVAVLTAPLLYCAIGLALDLANLVTPAPDFLGWLGRQLNEIDSAASVPAATLIRLGVVAALPGLAIIGIATLALDRVWRHSPLFAAGELAGRAPDAAVLTEERLANVAEEMALAAGIPPPRVVLVPGGANAAAVGRDQDHVTLVIGEDLPASVSREQLEGIVAHLIGSVVDGDMKIGLRVTTTLSLFWLTAEGVSLSGGADLFRKALRLGRVLIAPHPDDTIALLGSLGDPFAGASDRRPAPTPKGGTLTWRDWLLMPLMGPIVITAFLTGMVTQFFLEPLIALAWRQRKYMADAMAVELTRDPDALAGALAAISGIPTAVGEWAAHLAVAADRRGSGGPFGRSLVPIFPSVEKRVAALNRMGAHVSLAARRRMPWPIAAGLGLVGVVVGGLMAVVVVLLVVLSAALSGLFTLFPTALVHALLRWVAR